MWNMDEHIHSPTQVNSIDMSKVLHTRLAYMNKKRKFQDEQLGMPLSKHLCSYQTFAECGSSSTSIGADEFSTYMINGENEGRHQYDDSELESGQGSNSFNGDTDSFMSSDAKTDPVYPKSYLSDQPASSFYYSGNWSKDDRYSLESSLTTKSKFPDRSEQTSICRDSNRWNTLLDYEEHLLEFGSHGDCNCPECKTEDVQLPIEKELQDLLYSNGKNPNNYVLSSGRRPINQDAEPGAKKLTIDKEFEEYFSMLML